MCVLLSKLKSTLHIEVALDERDLSKAEGKAKVPQVTPEKEKAIEDASFLHTERLSVLFQMVFYLQGYDQQFLQMYSLEGRYLSYTGNLPDEDNLPEKKSDL